MASLLDGLIFDGVYGSRILFLLLFTFGTTYPCVFVQTVFPTYLMDLYFQYLFSLQWGRSENFF